CTRAHRNLHSFPTRRSSDLNGSNPPVFLQKPESDANFEKLTRVLFENESIVTAAFGSHNVRSIAHAQAVADELGIDRSRFEFQRSEEHTSELQSRSDLVCRL